MELPKPSSGDGGFSQGQALPSDPALASLEQVWSSIMPLFQEKGIAYDEAAGQFVDVEKKSADAARQIASTRKDSFVKIMAAWDAEHDKTVTELANQKHRNPFTRKDTLVAQIRTNIVSASHSWKDVSELLANAQHDYDNPTGPGAPRKWFRRAADKADLIGPFVGFIPETDYTSVICAGLKFILGACKAAKKFQEEAFDLISKLPEKIDIAGQYSELYKLDVKLQQATSELYCDILWAMEGLIYWLTKDHTFEWLRPLFQQNSYDPLKGRIEKVGKSSTQVEMIVKLCDSKQLSKIGRRVEDTSNMALNFMRVQFKQAKWFQAMLLDITNLIQQQIKEEQPKSYISQQELLRLLCTAVDSLGMNNATLESAYSTPTQKVLQIGFSMDVEIQSRSKWLMADANIGHWFRSTRSRTLLVNGNSSLDRVTPVSFFCAILNHSLASIDSIVVLSHFCGLASPADSDNKTERHGSSGLLRNVLTQLVHQWRFGDLVCVSKGQVESLKRTAPELGLREERRLFRKLVTALPAGQPLFIIVDGINYYETSEFKAETKEVVAEVNALLDNDNVGPLIKVMVTSATRSFEVSDLFEEDERLEMPSRISEGMAGFADMQFGQKFGKAVARLQDMPRGGRSA